MLTLHIRVAKDALLPMKISNLSATPYSYNPIQELTSEKNLININDLSYYYEVTDNLHQTFVKHRKAKSHENTMQGPKTLESNFNVCMYIFLVY